ncbi:hypothetical protein Tco_0792122 [Tanacetum coccineum]
MLRLPRRIWYTRCVIAIETKRWMLGHWYMISGDGYCIVQEVPGTRVRERVARWRPQYAHALPAKNIFVSKLVRLLITGIKRNGRERKAKMQEARKKPGEHENERAEKTVPAVPSHDSVYCQESLDKILEELEELKRDQRMLKELKKQIAEEQMAKENMNFEASKVQKKEQAYEEEKYSAACRYMLSVTCDDEDDYIPLGDLLLRNFLEVDLSDDFEDIEYVSLEEVNDVDQEEKEFNLEDIFQIQDVILREKLYVHRLISNIESLKVNSTPDRVLESPSPFPIPVVDSDAFFEESDTSLSHSNNSLPGVYSSL